MKPYSKGKEKRLLISTCVCVYNKKTDTLLLLRFDMYNSAGVRLAIAERTDKGSADEKPRHKKKTNFSFSPNKGREGERACTRIRAIKLLR